MIFLQVAAAVLTVFGAYSVIRLVGELFFTPKSITAAVLVTSEKELDELELLLREADRHSLRQRGQPPVVLIDRSLLRTGCTGCADRADCAGGLTDTDAAAHIAAHGVRWFPADLTGGAQKSEQE